MRREISKRWVWALCLALVACGSSGNDGGAAGTSAGGANVGAAPSNLTAGPLGGGVHLTWQDNSSDEQAFEIERREGSAAFAALASVPFDMALYHDADVVPGGTYTYRVRARFPAGFSTYSNEATATVPAMAGAGAGAGGTGTAGGGTGVAGTGGAAGAAGGGTGGAAGAAGTAGMPGTDAGAGSRVVSFQSDIVPLLVQSCGSTNSSCHNRDQAVGRIMPQFGPCQVIWFAAVDEPLGALYTSGPNMGQQTGCPDVGFYDRLTTLHSMLCDAPSWAERPVYVVPNDLDASLLYQVVAGDPSMGGSCSLMGMPVERMPKDSPPFDTEQIATIRDWIMQGAPDN